MVALFCHVGQPSVVWVCHMILAAVGPFRELLPLKLAGIRDQPSGESGNFDQAVPRPSHM
jgi:hypothetical protein